MGKQWKQCQTLFLGSPITADGDCSHEIKRRLLLGIKALSKLKNDVGLWEPEPVCSCSFSKKHPV